MDSSIVDALLKIEQERNSLTVSEDGLTITFDKAGFEAELLDLAMTKQQKTADIIKYLHFTGNIITTLIASNLTDRATFYVWVDGHYKLKPDIVLTIEKSIYHILKKCDLLNKMSYTKIAKKLLIEKVIPCTKPFEDLNDDQFLQQGVFPVFTKESVYLIRKDATKTVSPTPSFRNRFVITTPKDDPTPHFDAFLSEITDGDLDLQKTILQLLSLSLTPLWIMSFFVFFIGDGLNGKTTLLEILRLVLGRENATSIPLSEINSQTIEPLGNCLANLSTENDGGIFSEATLKSLASGEKRLCNSKYKTPYTITTRAKMYFAMNKLPQITDATYGMWRRCIVVPLTKKITNPDNTFIGKVMSEAGGIAFKLLKELREVVKTGDIYRCDAVLNATKKYQELSNTVVVFITELKQELASYEDGQSIFVEEFQGKSGLVSKQSFCESIDTKKYYPFYQATFVVQKLYERFNRWCLQNGYRQQSARSFRTVLAQLKVQGEVILKEGPGRKNLLILRINHAQLNETTPF